MTFFVVFDILGQPVGISESQVLENASQLSFVLIESTGMVWQLYTGIFLQQIVYTPNCKYNY